MGIPRAASALLLVLVVLAAFGRTLANGFAWDDVPYLVENPAVQDPPPVAVILLDPATHTSGETVRTYRPLRTMLFGLQYRVFGDAPAGYHAVNLLLHTAVALLAWRLLRRFTAPAPALLAALLFAAHPLQNEVTASIKAQDDLLAAVFVLSSCLVFATAAERPGRMARAWPVLPLFALGVLAKESALVLPGLLAGLLAAPRDGRRERARSALPLIGGLTALGVLFLAARARLLGAVEPPGAAEPAGGGLLAAALTWIPNYGALFAWPGALTIDHTNLFLHGLASPWFWLSVVVQGALVVAAWRSGSVALRFGTAWFYVALLPSLNVLEPSFAFAERFVYLPLLGLSAIAAALLAAAAGRIGGRRGMTVFVATSAVAVALLAGRSFVRSGDWRDSATLYRSALAVNPDARVMRSFLVAELLRDGKEKEAREVLRTLPVDADRPPRSALERGALQRLGVLALRDGDAARAAAIFGRIASGPYAKPADLVNYGTALNALGDHERAREALERAVAAAPEDAGVWRMLGQVALDAGDFAAARRNLDRACRLDPSHAVAWYLGIVAARRDAGDAAAAACLDDAARAGARLGALFAEEDSLWRDAQPVLRDAIRRHAESVDKASPPARP